MQVATLNYQCHTKIILPVSQSRARVVPPGEHRHRNVDLVVQPSGAHGLDGVARILELDVEQPRDVLADAVGRLLLEYRLGAGVEPCDGPLGVGGDDPGRLLHRLEKDQAAGRVVVGDLSRRERGRDPAAAPRQQGHHPAAVGEGPARLGVQVDLVEGLLLLLLPLDKAPELVLRQLLAVVAQDGGQGLVVDQDLAVAGDDRPGLVGVLHDPRAPAARPQEAEVGKRVVLRPLLEDGGVHPLVGMGSLGKALVDAQVVSQVGLL